MAYSHKEWEVVRAFFERGLSLADIVDRDEVSIKSKSQISKRATKDGWVKSEKETLLLNEVSTKQALAAINEQKETLKETDLFVHNTLVSEAASRMEWLNKAALKNVQEAMKADCGNQRDFKHRADTVLKAKEAVFGKTPETVITNTNAQQNNNDPAAMLREIAERLPV